MDIEFHYYITYILAQEAGFTPSDAYIVAYSSQYIDDNKVVYAINGGEEVGFKNYISQTKNILKPKEEQLQIYPCFHFVPGLEGDPLAQREDGKTHPLNTTPDSPNANRMFDDAIQSKDLYRIGIATHAYADTWAHQNFVGCKNDFNKSLGFLESIIPNIGHADSRYQPDIPCLVWKDNRLVDENRRLSNKTRFLDAAFEIFSKFCSFTGTEDKLDSLWAEVSKKISYAMGAESSKDREGKSVRIKKYKELLKLPDYKEKAWFDDAVKVVKKIVRRNNRKGARTERFYLGKDTFSESHWYGFQLAAKVHQKQMMRLIDIIKDSA